MIAIAVLAAAQCRSNFATDRTPEQAADGPTRSAARPQPQPPCPPLACSPSKNLVDCVPAKNNARQRSPNPDERSDRDPQISIDRARSNRRPFLPAVSSLGGFRTPTPHPARPSFKGAGVRNPRMRARKSITLLVSVNSDLSDRMHSLPTCIRSDLVIPNHDPSIREEEFFAAGPIFRTVP